MRILLLAPEIPDYCIEYAEMLAESCDVLLCIADKHFLEGRVKPSPRLEVRWLPWPRLRQAKNVFFVRALSQIVRSWKPDVVHLLNESNVWLNLLVPALRRIPFVVTVHDVRTHHGDTSSAKVPRSLMNVLIRQSDAIIVHGETLRRDAIKELPIKPERIFVIPHPPLLRYAEIARERGFKKPEDGLYRVLFFGRIHEYKGLAFLIEAATLVQQKAPQVRVIIAGTGDDLTRYRSSIAVAKNIELRNRFIPEIESAQLFAECDLLALPYIEASQSGVLMIAMAFGMPVVATDVGEMPAVVKETKMGMVIPPRNSRDLAVAITQIAADPVMRKQYSDDALRATRHEYSRKNIASKARSIYETILSAKRT